MKYRTLAQYCAENETEALLSQWDRSKNGALTPEQVTPNSHKKVWWRCEKGHSWSAVIQARSRGNGCPYCAGKIITPEGSNLATEHPEIAARWHGEKNGSLRP